MSYDKFQNRHIGVTDSELTQILNTIGIGSVDALIKEVIPYNIQIKRAIGIDKVGMSEYEFSTHIRALSEKNRQVRTFIGMGYYGCSVPAAIHRNVMENPAWYTPCTSYQAEISQGRLEALLNYQKMTTSLTGMEVGNSSLLDEGTAVAESVAMMYGLRSENAIKQGRNTIFVDENIFPQTLDVLMTRSEPLGIDIICDNFEEYEFTGKEFGVIVQYPCANGELKNYEAFATTAHENGALVTAIADLMSLTLLKSPAEWGADIATGSTQRMGLPMGYGGPHTGYITTKQIYKDNLPGHIIEYTQDRLGNKALCIANQSTNQHTTSALMAMMSGFYAVYHGSDGLKKIAQHINSCAITVAKELKSLGYNLTSTDVFDTLEVECEVSVINQLAQDNDINLYYPNDGQVIFSFDEMTTLDEIKLIVAIFATAIGKKSPKNIKLKESNIPAELARKSEFLTDSLFSDYRSETKLIRYIKQLERKDLSMVNGMIALGSSSMKLNSAVSMMSLSLSGFSNIHPFAPEWQTDGYTELIKECESLLSAITGFAATSLQPNSGVSAEYTALLVIRAYHQSRGHGYRDVVLIPESTYDINSTPATMAGFRIITVKCDSKGYVDVVDLTQKAEEYSSDLSCLMITYPSAYGVFESKIREIVDTIHDAGGQVYVNGTNMNAQIAITNPGYIGADICNLSLENAFAMPHSGGCSGVGAIGVASHLAPFRPSHPIVPCGGDEGITAVSSAPYGSAMLLPITYGYIKMMGENGLRRATEMSIVNANYISSALADDYTTLYTGVKNRVGHKFVLDLREFHENYGVKVADIARRLIDYGFHAPTLSDPIEETITIEPTESESMDEMDRFIEAMRAIKKECELAMGISDNPISNAPHPTHELTANVWSHTYSREVAAYPLEWIKENKFFTHISKTENKF